MAGPWTSSPWRVLVGGASRKAWGRQVQGGGGQHRGPCALGGLLGPQEEDAWVLIRGGAGEGFRCLGR